MTFLSSIFTDTRRLSGDVFVISAVSIWDSSPKFRLIGRSKSEANIGALPELTNSSQ